MEKEILDAYLYDFYGELLSERARRLYEASRFLDLSLSEIAAEEGISRQAVFDLNKRSEEKLLHYEEKLRLVERFLKAKERARSLAEENPALAEKINEITGLLFEDY